LGTLSIEDGKKYLRWKAHVAESVDRHEAAVREAQPFLPFFGSSEPGPCPLEA
jgi:hypothetical protein